MNDEINYMAQIILDRCRNAGIYLACAESCTGGLISSALTEISGSSDVFLGGIVSYSENIKTSILGVDSGLIDKYGVVSHETARAMAYAARKKFGADIAVSTTGIAGPTGAEPGKPVGTVFFGLSNKKDTISFTTCRGNSRQEVRERAVAYSLKLIIDSL